MVPVPIRYPLDKTGLSVDNKIVAEPHTLVNRSVRAVAPLYGPFFTESLVVRDVTTGLPLTYGTQYIATEMDVAPTGMFGKEICGIILIKDTSVSSQVEIDYQCLGGEYSLNSQAIVDMLNSASFDNRPVAWGDIISKPDAFEPADHFHDAGDIYGFEYVVTAIERLRGAILIGDSASHDEIYRYIDSSNAEINQRITTVETNLNSHTGRIDNPHQTTKAQVGLGSVDNYATASQAQAEAGTASNLFMTPQRTAQAISVQTATFAAHIANTNNPHGTTKVHVGLGSVNNFDLATLAEAQAGTSNVKYMTPYLTAQAITVQAGALIQSHVNDQNNPHNTTKAQVGLSNVLNYGVADTAAAQTGTRNDLYMTPARVTDAITFQVGTAFTAHVQNLSNPHQVTKAQVGLSNVLNYGISDASAAQAGSRNDLYMTPLSTSQAITFQVGNALTAHVQNLGNPHGTTKVQVGLGSVDNFATAGQVDAQNGTRNDLFMTPLATAQAINVQAAVLVNNHAGRTDNPHSTTKAQVGLGNVDNFVTASTAEAQAGNRTDAFMTPARVKEAINALGAPAWYQGWIGAPGWDANALPGSRSGFTYSNNAPYGGPLVHFDAGGYGLQLNSTYNGQALAYRTRNGDGNTWNGWKTVAHSDGSNVSGTWPINITGSASSANTANSSTTSYAATVLGFQGNLTAPTGPLTIGGILHGVYNNGYPTTYGNVLTLTGGGGGQFLMGWSGTSGAHADNYIRSMRDTGNTWSPWAKLVTDVNISSLALMLATGGTVNGGTTFNAAMTINADLTVVGLPRTGNWWRSTGVSGWLNETYNGGWYMTQAGYVDGYNNVQIRATDFWTTSDERIKTNIVPIQNARERLYGTVSGYMFDKNGLPSMGLLAQQVQKEFSVAVIETAENLPGTEDKILTVNYQSMLGPVIAAGAETSQALYQLQFDHNELKAKHAALEEDVAELKRQMAILMSR